MNIYACDFCKKIHPTVEEQKMRNVGFATCVSLLGSTVVKKYRIVVAESDGFINFFFWFWGHIADREMDDQGQKPYVYIYI